MLRTQVQILLGIIAVLITTIVVIIYASREQERMETFEEGHRAAAIEVGAELFYRFCFLL